MNFDLNKLTVIYNKDSKDRRTIHKYLYTKVPKTSVYVSHFPAEIKMQIIACSNSSNCTKTYEYKIDEDDYINKYCKRCRQLNDCSKFGYKYDYECECYYSNSTYTPEIKKTLYKNNCILVGNILNGYCMEKHVVTEHISEEEFKDAMSKCQIHGLNNPDDFCLNKRRIVYNFIYTSYYLLFLI